MHQIRYFLAVARTLNFTRAAEECHVAQPSLTRAIKLLEGELGGDLFRRERNQSHLTDLGQRMLPLLQQCFDSANSARSLASFIKSGGIAPLRLGLSHTIGVGLIVRQLTAVAATFKGLELKFLRGDAATILETLKSGEADLALAGPMMPTWDRLDTWPLFSEKFCLAVNAGHHLAKRNTVDIGCLAHERLLARAYCESSEQIEHLLREHGAITTNVHQVASDSDAIGLIAANVGVSLLPQSVDLPEAVRRISLSDFPLTRSVNVYAVAGRPRPPVAAALLKLLRAADWSGLDCRMDAAAAPSSSKGA